MNTVFKFYFQGWVLMACASAYGVWWVSKMAWPALRSVFQFSVAVLIAAGLVYPVMGYYSRVEGFQYTPDLDAAATVAGSYPNRWAAQPDDWMAIEWLIENGKGTGSALPLILEAPGASYQHTSRVSAFTGFPTLLGWTGHEWQWRGNGDVQNLREPSIQTIYTTRDGSQALVELRRWNVDYVIVGDVERRYIDRICQNPDTLCNPTPALEKFEQILIPVFSAGGTTVYAVPE